eukprot:g5341.t1
MLRKKFKPRPPTARSSQSYGETFNKVKISKKDLKQEQITCDDVLHDNRYRNASNLNYTPKQVNGRSRNSSTCKTPLLHNGTLINKRWKVSGKIGEGTFSQVFALNDIRGSTITAAKIQRQISDVCTNQLQRERDVFRALRSINKKSCKVYYYGPVSESDSRYVLVMDRYGANLSQLRKKQPRRCFPLHIVFAFASKMLLGLKDLHEVGYVHRDVKPSNFLVFDPNLKKGKQSNFCSSKVLESDLQIQLADFGLARYMHNRDGSVKEERSNTGFRGSSLYASANAHRKRDLGPRDDLWSLIFSTMELAGIRLPWGALLKTKPNRRDQNDIAENETKEEERKDVGDMKEKYTHSTKAFLALWSSRFNEALEKLYNRNLRQRHNEENDLKELLEMPLERFVKILSELEFNEIPDYEELYEIFDGIYLFLKTGVTSRVDDEEDIIEDEEVFEENNEISSIPDPSMMLAKQYAAMASAAALQASKFISRVVDDACKAVEIASCRIEQYKEDIQLAAFVAQEAAISAKKASDCASLFVKRAQLGLVLTRAAAVAAHAKVVGKKAYRKAAAFMHAAVAVSAAEDTCASASDTVSTVLAFTTKLKKKEKKRKRKKEKMEMERKQKKKRRMEKSHPVVICTTDRNKILPKKGMSVRLRTEERGRKGKKHFEYYSGRIQRVLRNGSVCVNSLYEKDEEIVEANAISECLRIIDGETGASLCVTIGEKNVDSMMIKENEWEGASIVGLKVLVRLKNKKSYPGWVKIYLPSRKKKEKYLIQFDDGDTLWVNIPGEGVQVYTPSGNPFSLFDLISSSKVKNTEELSSAKSTCPTKGKMKMDLNNDEKDIIKKLKNKYFEVYGTQAKGRFSNDCAWLRGKISKKEDEVKKLREQFFAVFGKRARGPYSSNSTWLKKRIADGKGTIKGEKGKDDNDQDTTMTSKRKVQRNGNGSSSRIVSKLSLPENCTFAKGLELVSSDRFVGQRIQTRFLNRKKYCGYVVRFKENNKRKGVYARWKIVYDDGDEEWRELPCKEVEFIENQPVKRRLRKKAERYGLSNNG